MLDSDFWRDHAEKFRMLDPNATLRAEWSFPAGNQFRESWNVVAKGDSAGLSLRAQFEPLAIRAGIKLRKDADAGLLEIWLTRVKEHGPQMDLVGPSGAAFQEFGCIKNLCQTSADVCNALESRALEIEHAPQTDSKPSPCSDPPVADEKDQRRSQVDEFLQECNEMSQEPIRRRHLWLSIGHSGARQFEYWQRNDPKATEADNQNFGRILGMKPEDFVNILRQKQLLK